MLLLLFGVVASWPLAGTLAQQQRAMPLVAYLRPTTSVRRVHGRDAGGVFKMRDDRPTPRIRAAPHRTT
jgi:hypothetical protein